MIHKNRDELNRYRTFMETRDEEMRKMMQMEEERLQMVLDEYKQRYDRERENGCRRPWSRLPTARRLSLTALPSP